MSEIWLPVVGFEDTYSVSSFGRVRRDIRGPGTQAGRILKPHVTQKGYHSVCLSRDLKGHTIFVHVVVAEAFIGPRPEGQEINHKDADKQHNVPSNLEWTTHLLNIRHSEALGLRTPRRGETHHSARYSDATIAAVRASSLSSKRASEVFGISSGYIKMLRRGEFRVHGPAEASL